MAVMPLLPPDTSTWGVRDCLVFFLIVVVVAVLAYHGIHRLFP